MFNIGPSELLVVLLVALLVVGPKKLPEVGKTIGRSLREFRKAQDDLKSSLNLSLDYEPESAPTRPASETVENPDPADPADPE